MSMSGAGWIRRSTDPSRTFFSSDLHFGHVNIIRYCNRPFASVPEMNEALIEKWNSAVGPDDEVWVLGDVALGRIVDSLPLVSRLQGHKKLVAGNHDRVWIGLGEKSARFHEMYSEAGFEEIFDRVELDLGERVVRLCHFPTSGDSHDADRYTDWRPTVEPGQWLIHGHVHDSWKVRGREINVGVDVWDYRPVSAPTLLDLMRTKDHLLGNASVY